MVREWFTKPDVQIAFWLLSPVWYWIVDGVKREVQAWNAARSEASARMILVVLCEELENPPSVLASLAPIICLLPLPIAMTACFLVLFFIPFQPTPLHIVDPNVVHMVVGTVMSVMFFCLYMAYSILAVYGIRVAYRLRDGEHEYAQHYKAGVQKQIDRLKKKYPRLSMPEELP
jgi:hypothetical protein